MACKFRTTSPELENHFSHARTSRSRTSISIRLSTAPYIRIGQRWEFIAPFLIPALPFRTCNVNNWRSRINTTFPRMVLCDAMRSPSGRWLHFLLIFTFFRSWHMVRGLKLMMLIFEEEFVGRCNWIVIGSILLCFDWLKCTFWGKKLGRKQTWSRQPAVGTPPRKNIRFDILFTQLNPCEAREATKPNKPLTFLLEKIKKLKRPPFSPRSQHFHIL